MADGMIRLDGTPYCIADLLTADASATACLARAEGMEAAPASLPSPDGAVRVLTLLSQVGKDLQHSLLQLNPDSTKPDTFLPHGERVVLRDGMEFLTVPSAHF